MSFSKNLNKLLIIILAVSFSENVKGSDHPISSSLFDVTPQQFTRYVLKYHNIEILLPRKFDDNISRLLITKLSNIINESSCMVDSAYTEQELQDFSEKSGSTLIPAQESFFATQNLFFGNKYIVSQYTILYKKIAEKVSEKTLTYYEFCTEINNFIDKFIVDPATSIQKDACRRLLINANAIMEQQRLRLLKTIEEKTQAKELWIHLIIAYKFAEKLQISRGKSELETNWRRFYDTYIK